MLLDFLRFAVTGISPVFVNSMFSLKGPGHAILGNFSPVRIVIELTKISK